VSGENGRGPAPTAPGAELDVVPVVLAGGAATRLRPLTLDRPAALLPVANRPLVEHVLEHLARHRVAEATVCLHHRPAPLEAHLGDGTPWGLGLRYALERAPLGTAGAVRAAAARWTRPVLVAYGTALTTAELWAARAIHERHGAGLTLVVTPAPAGAADVALDPGGCVTAGVGPGLTPCAFVGLAIVEPEVLGALLRAGQPADLVADLVPRCLAAGVPVRGALTTAPSLVVRSPGDLVRANRLALAGELPGLVLPGFEIERGIRVSRGAVVHRTARLVPPVLLGANAVVGRGATVEATVVGDDVLIGARSTVRGTVLVARTYVGRGLSLDGALVDRERLRRSEGGPWTLVRDPRLLGDTRAPLRPPGAGLAGRLGAAAVLAATAPAWLLLGAALALETGGRPLRARRVVGARGGDAKVWRAAVHGPTGRLVRRLGLVRAPGLWSVATGDLRWVGTGALHPAEWAALAEAAELPPAAPGLVTLADLAPGPLHPADRLALDRLYAATRTGWGDLRLLASALGRRIVRAVRPSA
jgi:NDP-sugar pyrophosphorylase family protein